MLKLNKQKLEAYKRLKRDKQKCSSEITEQEAEIIERHFELTGSKERNKL